MPPSLLPPSSYWKEKKKKSLVPILFSLSLSHEFIPLFAETLAKTLGFEIFMGKSRAFALTIAKKVRSEAGSGSLEGWAGLEGQSI